MFNPKIANSQDRWAQISLEIPNIINDLDGEVSIWEKVNTASELKLQNRSWSLFWGPKTNVGKKVDQLRKLQTEMVGLNQKLIKIRKKAIRVTKDLSTLENKFRLEPEDYVTKVALQQLLLACEELMNNITQEIADKGLKMSDLLEATEIKKRVKAFENTVYNDAQRLLIEEAAFFGIRRLFEELHETQFARKHPEAGYSQEISAITTAGDDATLDFIEAYSEPIINPLKEKPKDVLSARTKLIEEFNVPRTIRSIQERLPPDQQITSDFQKLNTELKTIEQTIKTGVLPEIHYVLNEEELLDMKLLLIDRKIALLKQKIKFNFFEEGESIETIQDQIQRLEIQKVARRDLNQVLLQKTTAAQKYLGKLMSVGIDAAARVYGRVMGLSDDVAYGWEEKDWGRLLLVGSLQEETVTEKIDHNFKQSINTLKKQAKELDGAIKMMLSEEKELKDRIENPGLRGGGSLESLKTQYEALAKALTSARDHRQRIRIDIRAAFLEKLIEGVGEREKKRNDLHVSIEHKLESLEKLTRLIEQRELEWEAMSAEEQSVFKKIVAQKETAAQEIRQMSQESERLRQEVVTLKDGYREQIKKYKKLDRPEQSLLDQLASFGEETVINFITLGYVNKSYREPKDFELDMQFAEHGYNWFDGLKLFLKTDGSDIPAFLTEQVHQFLTFADDHPNIAIELAGDIALTVSLLGDESTLETLTNGMRSRVYTRAALGQMGRDIEPRLPMDREKYEEIAKWKALGDLVRYGPLMAKMPKVALAAVEGVREGNIIKTVTNPLVTALMEGGKAGAIQTASKLLRPTDEIAAIGVLSALSGASMHEILAEQRNIALLTTAGEGRRFLFKPQFLMKGIARVLKNQYEAFKEASFIEKAVRVGAVVVAPPAIAAAGVGVAIAVANPLGVAAAVTIAIVGLGLALLIPTAFITFANRFIPPMRRTMERARRNQARVVARQYREKLVDERKTYMIKLREKGLIFDTTLPSLDDVTWCFTEEQAKQCEKALESCEASLVKKMNQKVEDFQKRNTLIQPKDVSEIFSTYAGYVNLKKDIDAIITEETKESTPPLSKRQKNELALVSLKIMSQNLQEKWLISKLDDAFENSMVSIILKSDSPEQYQQEAEARIREKKAEVKKDLEDKLEATLPEELSGQANKIARYLTK